MLFKVILIVGVSLFLGPASALPQDAPLDEELTVSSEEADDIVDIMSRGFKKALEELDMEKALKRSENERQISSLLDATIKEWIGLQSSRRKNGLNSTVEQSWQELMETPLEYRDYYLRDFSYRIDYKNLVQTSSIVYPYAAEVRISELLYVEQAPLIAEPRSQYQYTAAIVSRIDLRYNMERNMWEIADITPYDVILTKGWPADIRKRAGSYFIPAE